MAEIDYDYGEQLDYGYGDTEPEMIAENDALPLASKTVDEYGYGSEIDLPQHANDSLDQPSTHVRRGPKRRCSVTKFSLENDDTTPSSTGIRPTLLTAASVIENMRNGTYTPTPTSGISTGSNTDDFMMMMVTPDQSIDFCITDADLVDDPDLHAPNNESGGMHTIAVGAKEGKRNGMFRLLSLKRN